MSGATKFRAAMELLGLQGFAAFIWTCLFTLPFWFTVTRQPGGWALASDVCLSAAVTVLGLYRYSTFGEIRKRVFGPLPHTIRSLLLAAPCHAIHGATLAVLVVTWLRYDSQFLIGDEDEKDQQRDQAFFFYFMQGWLFSSTTLLFKFNQLTFGRSSHKTRLASLVEKAPEIGFQCAVLLLLGFFLSALSSIWLTTTVALVGGDALLRTLLTDRTRKGDVADLSQLSTFAAIVANNSVEECFKALPLISPTDTWAPVESGLMKMLPSNLQGDSLQKWWAAQRQLYKYEGKVTGVNSATFLVNLSNERFKTILQILYRCDALEEGAAFAKKVKYLSFSFQALRYRAFATLSLPEISSLNDWCSCVNSCLDLMDAQTARLKCYLSVASAQVEPPRNLESGLDDTDAYLTAKPDETPAERQERVRLAKDIQWDLDHKLLTGRMWWKRFLFGSFTWGFDPIYEENTRRRRKAISLPPSTLDSLFKRETQEGLVPDLSLMTRVSESLVLLLKRHRTSALTQVPSNDLAQVTDLVLLTMNRLIEAGEACLQLLELEKEDSKVIYALLFCLDRDIQMIRTL